ncbi:MAG: hypothetical protein WCJ24_02185 [Candidatus Saccharibacteria bacterium]
MDHNTLPAPQFELPKPKAAPEQILPTDASVDHSQATENRNMETPDFRAPSTSLSVVQAAQSVADTNPINAAAAGILAVSPSQTPAIDSDLLADDGDLIEKAWVQKAKAIIEHTKNDPYNQNLEINKVKKDYIQKRYQKDVKLTDE